jgi:hypothetical protein
MEDFKFNLFRDYNLIVQNALKQICFYDGAGKDQVDIMYATPPMAFAKFLNKIQNGSSADPTISFYLKSINMLKEQNGNGWGTLSFVNGMNIKTIRNPQRCSLQYEVTINANSEIDGDWYQAQILLNMPFNRPYTSMLKEQFVVLYADSPENGSSVEPGDGKDRISKRTLTITIQTAYLDYPIREVNYGVIKKINTDYMIETGVMQSEEKSQED